MESYLDVATLTGKKNLDGRLVAKSAPGLPFLLTEGMQVRLVPPVLAAPRSVEVASVSAVDDGCAVVAFSEVTDASVAEALVGCHCLVGRSALGAQATASAAMSAALLSHEGWRFVDETSARTGWVAFAEEVAGQLLLTVALDDAPEKEHLVPYADELVVDEDASRHLIVMACPSGLFDL